MTSEVLPIFRYNLRQTLAFDDPRTGLKENAFVCYL